MSHYYDKKKNKQNKTIKIRQSQHTNRISENQDGKEYLVLAGTDHGWYVLPLDGGKRSSEMKFTREEVIETNLPDITRIFLSAVQLAPSLATIESHITKSFLKQTTK